MEANELRIGNWYNEFGIPKQVSSEFILKLDSIQKSGKIAIDVSPIPLTEDWLLKFGFEKMGVHYFLRRLKLDFSSLGVARFKYQGKVVYLDYVHQLQNLYFALTQKELSI